MLIDSLKFSRERKTQSGILPVAGFDRLRDSLFLSAATQQNDSKASFEVQGGVDTRDNAVLRLQVSVCLPLQCQRCLQALDYDLVIDTVLRLAPESMLEALTSDDPDEPDCIEASAELDVAALIEDEILLALPAYPRHPEGSCKVAGGTNTMQDSAFSVLAKLSTPKPS